MLFTVLTHFAVMLATVGVLLVVISGGYMNKPTPARKRALAKKMLQSKLPDNPKVKAGDTVISAREMQRLINTL